VPVRAYFGTFRPKQLPTGSWLNGYRCEADEPLTSGQSELSATATATATATSATERVFDFLAGVFEI
jgi:hypothetical protein